MWFRVSVIHMFLGFQIWMMTWSYQKHTCITEKAEDNSDACDIESFHFFRN